MSSSSDDTILPPPRRPINSGGLDGETVVPSNNTAGIHAPGDVIDNRYTVIREIGRGGMGVVYEVEDSVTSIRYAIKRLLPDVASNEQIVRAFVREGTAAERFSAASRYLVTTKTVGRDSAGFYVLMEMVTSPTLRQILKQISSGGLQPIQAIPILASIADALNDMHRSGLIHRDLKPENIFVIESDDSVSVQLVDFGLTRNVSSHTITGLSGAGSLRYMAPELFREEAATAAADVYAFGVIAYELLTGELPSFGDRLTDYVPDAAPELVSLVTVCLAGKPEKRPQSGNQLLSQFASLLVNSNQPKKPVVPISVSEPELAEPQPGHPTVIRTTVSFEGVQDGGIVEVDKVTLVKPYAYSMDIETNVRKPISVLVRWQDQVVFEKQITLVAGINQTLKIPQGYRVECAVPAWCAVQDIKRNDVRFPVTGLLSGSPFELTYLLIYAGAEFGKLSITPKPGANGLPFQYGLGTLTFDDVPSGCRVLVNGTEKGSAYTVPIVIGVPASLSVRVQDQNRVEVYRENVTLEASESMSLGGISEKIRLTPETDVNKLVNAKSESINKTEVESTESSMKDSVTESVSSKFEQRHNNPFLREYLIKVAFAFSGALSFLLADSFFKKFWITYCENLVSSGEAGKYDAYKGVSEQLLADKTLFALQNLPKIRMDDPHILSNILHGNLINISVFLLCCSAIVWILYKWKN